MDLSGLLTESKDLVGAINELFQNANNGKQLIANAIGDPVSADDTFSAMSNDINRLLSTFKTNMMNNGVTVESGDKFKSLIDKLSTLTDSEGKGVQYTEGMFNVRVDGNFYVADVELNFEPSIIILRTDYKYDPLTGTLVTGYTNILYNVFDSSDKYFVIDCYSSNKTVIEKTLTQTGNKFTFSLNLGNHYTLSTNKYYAFGVGEEDTTLRDSLASILTEEGVSVTEEDDMASLITKVDEEFDRKNVEIKNKPTLISHTGTGLSVSSKEKCIIYDLKSHNSSSQTVTVNLSDLLNSNFSIKSISLMIKNNCSANWAVKVSIHHYRGTQLIKTIANQVETSAYEYYSQFDITDIQANDTIKITGYDGGYTSGSTNYSAQIYMYYLCSIE